MSQGPGGGGDSRAREDRLADGGPEGGGDGGNGPETRGGGQENGQRSSAGTDDGSDAYDLYQRGLDLLSRGSAAAAAQLLARAHTAAPGMRSVLEALARAQFDARRYSDAAESFRQIVEASPADDYAQFGLGLSLARTGDLRGAAEHLALAAAMRPDLRHYAEALRGVRATLRARREAGLPDQIGPTELASPGSQSNPEDPPGPGSLPGPGLDETGAA